VSELLRSIFQNKTSQLKELIMEIWEVEEDYLIALIYEINRLGQSLLKFDEKVYDPFFSSRLVGIALRMLGLDAAADENSENRNRTFRHLGNRGKPHH
jgi:hypothetical protein